MERNKRKRKRKQEPKDFVTVKRELHNNDKRNKVLDYMIKIKVGL